MEADALVQAIVINRSLPAALDTEVLAIEKQRILLATLNTYLKEV